MTTMYSDPWAAAADPQEIVYSNDIYGDIALDMWFCTLKKGIGKTPYIDGQDNPNDRRTAVDINITDLSGVNYKRSFIAEIGADGWKAVTLPSIVALGIQDMRVMNGKFVHAVMTPFGEYTDKNSGEKKPRTAPKILAIFKSREECEAAAQGGAVQADWMSGPPPAAPTNGNGAAPANGAANDGERAIALSFLPAIVAGCRVGNGIDSAKLTAALNGNLILARHFTLASPEVAQAMAQALAEPAF